MAENDVIALRVFGKTRHIVIRRITTRCDHKWVRQKVPKWHKRVRVQLWNAELGTDHRNSDNEGPDSISIGWRVSDFDCTGERAPAAAWLVNHRSSDAIGFGKILGDHARQHVFQITRRPRHNKLNRLFWIFSLSASRNRGKGKRDRRRRLCKFQHFHSPCLSVHIVNHWFKKRLPCENESVKLFSEIR